MHEAIQELRLTQNPVAEDVDRILKILQDQGSLQFPTLSSGLFSASAGDSATLRDTGYQNVWARDNCQIIFALWKTGQKSLATTAARALLQFYLNHRQKFIDIIEGKTSPSDPMLRPHIRFDGETLSELTVRWSHAQNDALGYSLWIFSKLMRSGDLETTSDKIDLLRVFLKYFHAIRFWEDEDSGHWEETRKIEASSIGTVTAALIEFQTLLREQQIDFIDTVFLKDLIERGQATLSQILPAECIQPSPSQNRRYDAALLFLIYPLEVVDSEMALQILDDVNTHLTGPIGIRRYQGDSYWCANYRSLLSAEVRTSDFSDDLGRRDELLNAGQEAQWCLFDPLVSAIWGKRFQETGDPQDFTRQIEHFNRSMRHLTSAQDASEQQGDTPEHRFPESYFLENHEWVPNDICPLLWTQANVLLAIDSLKDSIEKHRRLQTEQIP